MNIMITGGTGSLGHALVENFVNNGHSVTVFSRDPHKQVAMRKKYAGVRFILGDITNRDALLRAMDGCDALVHAAAIKHIGFGESPLSYREMLRVNVDGTRAVVDAWGGRGYATFVSSDKAVSPVNLYGATKMLGEYEFMMKGHSAVRYGNVTSSAGSFLRQWVGGGKDVVVREPTPTRFYMPMRDAVSIVEYALLSGDSGVYVPTDLVSFSVLDVAKYMGCNVSREELHAGEKQHEILVADGDAVKEITPSIGMVLWGGMGNVSRYCSGNTIAKDTGAVVETMVNELSGGA